MVLDGESFEDRAFRDLPGLLQPGDLLVLNETRVIAARLIGERLPGGGSAEILLLHPADSLRYSSDASQWRALVRPARHLRTGARVRFGTLGEARVKRELPEGLREIEFVLDTPFESFLERAGRTPLPPYIRADSASVRTAYQTVFSRVAGSVAAPTASLHFTRPVLERIERRGIEIVKLTLAIGLGTFRPVNAERVDDHVMHAEAYAIPPPTAAAVARAKEEGRRVVAAGTSVVRALEGNRADYGGITAGEHTTALFITPGFRFDVVDAMITNFHLPRSTLLMLVSAFAGRERIMRAYAAAIERGYRFYSFGDAMWLTREG